MFLRSVSLFVELEPADLERLWISFRSNRFGAGDSILEEGKANRALHVIRSGRVRVSRGTQDGEVALTELVAGQTFGELSIIEDGVASATIAAVSDAEIVSISIEDLAAFLRERPAAAASFWRQVAIDLRRRLLATNDIVGSYFDMNRAMADNPTLRQVYAMCNR